MKLQITVNVPVEIFRQLRQLPDAEDFVSTVVKKAMESRPENGCHKIIGEKISQKTAEPENRESREKSRWSRFSTV